MHKFLIVLSMIPLVVSLLVLTLFSIFYMKDNLETQTKNTLRVAAIDLKEYYAYDLQHPEYLEGGWITYDPDYMDHLKYADVDLTVFRGDTRFCTSIIGGDGKRIEGTKASDGVIAEVINKGNEYYSDDVKINNIPYYVYYVPLKDANGNVVGMAFAGKACSEVQNAVRKMIIVCSCIAVVLFVVFVVLCLYLANKVAKPISACADTLSKLADGNLSVENDSKSGISETKALIFASNALRDKLSEIIGHVKLISGDLNTGANNVNKLSGSSSRDANQISSAMEDLAEGATDMANNVQEIGKQIGNLNELIATLTESSDALTVSSDNIANANNDAREYIDKVAKSSVQTVEAVHDIARQISSTNDAVQKIKEAVDMIASIASQTNLLALNASIEAARAGEAGRGFAVVATEIGSLSDQSSRSANEIRNIVDEIVKNSEASVELSANVAELIKQEQSFVGETQNKFEVLGKEISASLENIKNVTQDAQELEEVQNVITDAVQALSAISEENAASNQEVSASVTGIALSINEIAQSSDETRDNSDKLVDVISYFK